jgi:hypothetical protein
MMAVALSWLVIYPMVSLVIIYFGAYLTETNPISFGLNSVTAFLTLIPLAIFALAVRFGVEYFLEDQTWLAVLISTVMVLSITGIVIWKNEQKVIQAIKK